MPWLIEAFLNNNENLEESTTLHKAMIGLKTGSWTKKDDMKFWKEDHGNKKLLNYIENCNNIDDLEYIRKEIHMGNNQLQISYNNLKNIENNKPPEKGSVIQGNYDFYYKNYIKKGITSKDVQLVIQFNKNVLLPAISKRMKELKNQNKK